MSFSRTVILLQRGWYFVVILECPGVSLSIIVTLGVYRAGPELFDFLQGTNSPDCEELSCLLYNSECPTGYSFIV